MYEIDNYSILKIKSKDAKLHISKSRAKLILDNIAEIHDFYNNLEDKNE